MHNVQWYHSIYSVLCLLWCHNDKWWKANKRSIYLSIYLSIIYPSTPLGKFSRWWSTQSTPTGVETTTLALHCSAGQSRSQTPSDQSAFWPIMTRATGSRGQRWEGVSIINLKRPIAVSGGMSINQDGTALSELMSFNFSYFNFPQFEIDFSTKSYMTKLVFNC